MKRQVSLQSAIAAFLDELENGRRASPRTVRNYSRTLTDFDEFLIGHLGQRLTAQNFGTLTPAEIRAYLSFRRESGVSISTVRLDLSAIRTFAKFLWRQTGISVDSIMTVKAPKLPKRLPRPMPAPATASISDGTLPDDIFSSTPWVAARDRALFTLMYGTGLRLAEALGLTWEDVPATAEFVRVLGKGQKMRDVPFLAQVRTALADYREALSMAPDGAGQTYRRLKDGAPVFLGMRGMPLNPAVAQRQMRRVRAALGLDDSATPHALRHSFASDLLNGGVDLRSLQDLLGHSSLASTQRYTELSTDRLMDAYRSAHPRAGSGAS